MGLLEAMVNQVKWYNCSSLVRRRSATTPRLTAYADWLYPYVSAKSLLTWIAPLLAQTECYLLCQRGSQSSALVNAYDVTLRDC
ncbi:hypothetical protein NEOLEDRAFT_349596 [Neolentinus lepideus HHB14362 ss-1]|uniref:Uncharacterized protein n=1 Tax=Neolentinus lepideus HHB14362 ss-1 TaxID=1314782 RepID=A0A165SRK5_9AGAM|nr:hypothetical protein NEOLEDRAFT_349596 [Neolentinus lepideus HHB14362 ss-1]